MLLRRSTLGAIVAGAYILGSAFLITREMHGDGCMGWCYGLATFPEFLVLGAVQTEYFYSSTWQSFVIWLFAGGTIGFNALILYAIFGGAAWWGSAPR